MIRYVLVGLGAGLVFLILDGVIHANPLARRLYAIDQPLARPQVNALVGSAIDLAYGLVLMGLFVLLRPSLPGHHGLSKGVAFGLIVWFLRVVMSVAGDWVATTVSPATHAYRLATGFVQVMAVSLLLGVLLPPSPGEAAAIGGSR